MLSIEGDGWGVQVTEFQPGDVYTHVFTEPGEYAYYCSIHGSEQAGMVGTITVAPEAAAERASTRHGEERTMVSARLTKSVAGVIAVAIALTAVAAATTTPRTPSIGTDAAATVASTTEPVAGQRRPRRRAAPCRRQRPRPTATADDGVREVPAEYATIQDAVDAAAEGDLVLVAPGVYNEAVDVVTNNLTIRGLDRDGVILDGEFELDNGIRVLGASGVAVENLTARNYTAQRRVLHRHHRLPGVVRHDLPHRRLRHLRLRLDEGSDRQLAHGRQPRRRRVHRPVLPVRRAASIDVLSEHNGLGYSGTNSGGNLLIVNSTFRNNRAGIVPNSGSYELCYPERETTIVGNLVYSNNQTDTPAIDVALLAQGNGILLPGGVRNLVSRNRVFDHNRTGIGLVPFLEEDPNDDLPTPEEWSTPCAEQKNQVAGDAERRPALERVRERGHRQRRQRQPRGRPRRRLGRRGHLDASATASPTTSSPPRRRSTSQALAPCDGTGSGGDWTAGDLNVARWIGETASLPGEVDWKTAPLPELGAHENMPDPATAPARPATDVPMAVDLDAITVPDAPK